MAAKKPAVSTQLKQANARIEELEKKLADAQRAQEYASKRAADADAELDQMHALLDALPNALPKRDDGTYRNHTAMTRLASWLAARP